MLIAVTALTLSCKKEIVGPKGDKGESAASIVKTYSNVAMLSFNSSLGSYEIEMPNADVTQDVLNSGVVLVNVQQVNGVNPDVTGWYSLPYYINGYTTPNNEIKSYVKLGKVFIYTKQATGELFNVKVSILK